MNFLNGKEELDLVVKSLKDILPYATFGQMVKGSTEFVAIVTQEGEPPLIVRLKITFIWKDKEMGDYSLKIESSHELDKISDEMHAQKVVEDLINEVGLN